MATRKMYTPPPAQPRQKQKEQQAVEKRSHCLCWVLFRVSQREFRGNRHIQRPTYSFMFSQLRYFQGILEGPRTFCNGWHSTPTFLGAGPQCAPVRQVHVCTLRRKPGMVAIGSKTAGSARDPPKKCRLSCERALYLLQLIPLGGAFSAWAWAWSVTA